MRTLADYIPRGAFLAPRLMEELQPGAPIVGIDADAQTGSLLSIAGSVPIIVHSAAATDSFLSAIEASGLRRPEEVIRYDTREEYITLVRERMLGGELAWFAHPVPRDIFPAEPSLVNAELMTKLNLRDTVDRIVPEINRPKRRLIEGAPEVESALGQLIPGQVVKDARLPSSSGGAGVWLIRRHRHAKRARDALRGASRIVVEERVQYIRNHCVQFAAISEEEVVLVGSSEQRTSKSGHYIGNCIDPATPVSAEILALARGIALTAARSGFRGIAGFDILERNDGPPLAIDLNFRPNGSTPFLFAHHALSAQRNTPAAEFAFAKTQSEAADVLSCLRPMIDNGWLALLGLFDPIAAGSPKNPTAVRVMILGAELSEVAERRAILRRAGFGFAFEPLSMKQRIARLFKRRHRQSLL